MIGEAWNWLLKLAGSTIVAGAALFLLRDLLAKYVLKYLETKLEAKLEGVKAEMRDSEKELEHIRSFLVSGHKERETALQSKRLEAAEVLLRARHAVSQLSMAVEYMKILNVERILQDDGTDSKVIEFISTLLDPLNVDQKLASLNTLDMTTPRLYLSEKSLSAFDIYQSIVIEAALLLKVFCIPLPNKREFIKPNSLRKKIVEFAPNSKEGFEKFGDGYAYYWFSYFHDEVLRLLRLEISGTMENARDAHSAQRLALDSRRAQMNVLESLRHAGLPDSLLKADEAAEESSSVAKSMGTA